MPAQELLRFQVGGNAKLPHYTVTFSLPSGYTCPGACDCLSRADRKLGTITDGPDTQFRCFSASQESAFKSVRVSRWANMDLLKARRTTAAIRDLILESIPSDTILIRIHVGGDFYSQAYFDAWIEVAQRMPDVIFYAYTKSLGLWVNRMEDIPDNLRLVASRGGKFDKFIDEHDLPSATVVLHPKEAKKLGLPIDHDDSHARGEDRHSFALLIHGSQPAGSEASAALKRLKTEKVDFGYGPAHRAKIAAALKKSKIKVPAMAHV